MPAHRWTNRLPSRLLIMLSAVALMLAAATFFLPQGPALAGWSLVQDTRNSAAQDLPMEQVQVNEALGLHRSELVPLEIAADPAQPFDVAMTLDSQPVTVQFWPHSVRAAEFRVRAQLDNGELVEVDPGLERTVRGVIPELPGSNVAGSLLDDGLHALIILADGSTRWIEPVAAHVADAAPNLHVIYAGEDVEPIDGVCGGGIDPGIIGADAQGEAGGVEGGISGSSFDCVNLAIDADYEYFQKYSNSVVNVTSAVTLIVNTVNLQYESEVGISHEITEIIIRTSSSSNPYTTNGASALLSEFRSTWNSWPENNIQRNVAHLWTGRNLSGSTIGIAYLGRVCNTSWAYGLSQHLNSSLSWRADLFSHEIGHNWNASHCSCPNHTMNPSITGANTFHSSSIAQIESYKNGSSGWCTGACDGPGPDPDPTHPHDTCPGAKLVDEGAFEFDNALATTTGFDEGACDFTGDGNIQSDIWFRHTAQCTGDLTISLCNGDPDAGFDTKIAVYGASCPSQPNTAIACNDDACGSLSSVTIPVVQGQLVRIRIGTADGSEGEGLLTISCGSPAANCHGDLTGTGEVNVFDLLDLLGTWGSCDGCDADLDSSGDVNVIDLLELLGAWGPCP